MRSILCLTLCLLIFSGCALQDGVWVRKGFVPVSEGKLYYEAAGKGSAVVLIHGGQLDCRLWDEQWRLLADDFRAIRYDVRGMGKSSAPRRPYSSTDDLRALLAHLGVERVKLVGLSLGGRIAIDFALAHPEQVDKLILVGPGLSGFDWSAEQGQRLTRIYLAARNESPEAATELWLRDPYMAPAMENPRIAPRLRQLALDNSQIFYMNYFLERPLQPPAVGRLKEIKAPTLVFVGDRDVPDIQRLVDQLAAELPNVRKETVTNAGHIVNMEQPEAFNKLLLDFLKAEG